MQTDVFEKKGDTRNGRRLVGFVDSIPRVSDGYGSNHPQIFNYSPMQEHGQEEFFR